MGGKRKRVIELNTQFKCPFCSGIAKGDGRTIDCMLDPNTMTGDLHCWFCRAKFSMKITASTKPFDLYREWLDRRERIDFEL